MTTIVGKSDFASGNWFLGLHNMWPHWRLNLSGILTPKVGWRLRIPQNLDQHRSDTQKKNLIEMTRDENLKLLVNWYFECVQKCEFVQLEYLNFATSQKNSQSWKIILFFRHTYQLWEKKKSYMCLGIKIQFSGLTFKHIHDTCSVLGFCSKYFPASYFADLPPAVIQAPEKQEWRNFTQRHCQSFPRQKYQVYIIHEEYSTNM